MSFTSGDLNLARFRLLTVALLSLAIFACGGGGGSGAETPADATQVRQSTDETAYPATLTAAPGMSQIIVTWPSVDGAVSYNMYWGTGKGVTTASGAMIAGVSAPFTHTDLTDGVDYHYIVTAVMADGSESQPWPEVNTVSGSCHRTRNG